MLRTYVSMQVAHIILPEQHQPFVGPSVPTAEHPDRPNDQTAKRLAHAGRGRTAGNGSRVDGEADMQACRQAGWLAGWPTGWLAGRLAGRNSAGRTARQNGIRRPASYPGGTEQPAQ